MLKIEPFINAEPGWTFALLRFISEILDAEVEYDGETGQITIAR